MAGTRPPQPGDFAPLGDAEAQKIRESILCALAAEPERFLAAYADRFGNVLNADDAATLFDGYNQDRARYRVAVHPAATWIRDELFRRALASTVLKPAARVVFTAGGNAVGKTTALEFSRARQFAHVVFDSTFSSPAHARSLVDRVLATGWPITIMHVDRPLDATLLAMLDRARTEGRLVRIEQIIHSHRGAAETVRSLWNEFQIDPAFDFHFLFNGSNSTTEVSIEDTNPQDYTEIRKKLYDVLESEYRAGRITRPVRDGVRGLGK